MAGGAVEDGRIGDMHPITGLLIGATVLTGGLFLASVAMVAVSEPPTFPGDPNIGGGILSLCAALNLPVILGWGTWIAWKTAKLYGRKPSRVP
jgi:hypothetical protein